MSIWRDLIRLPIWLGGSVSPEGIRMQGMTDVGGLSKARLGRMHDIMAGHVDSGSMPGMVTLVSRHGDVHVDVIGKMAFGGAPMRRDSIFRITSMTKPVTAAAAMILVEECKLRLDDPVDGLSPLSLAMTARGQLADNRHRGPRSVG